MAFVPYLILSPSSILCLIGLLYGSDRTIPTPAEKWQDATVDLVIPAHNEASNIIFCLNSIAQQTLQPKTIYLVDDGSTDHTSGFAHLYAQKMKMTNLKIIQKKINKGKTPIVDYVAKTSDADVLVVLDADTMFASPNYIERLVQELYQGVGIACACGIILPITEEDRLAVLKKDINAEFAKSYPVVARRKNLTKKHDLQQTISNNYREELYLFLQQYIYHGEMVFFGSIINPVGCAVAYRRKYLLDVLDHYHKTLGHDLTTSEDIFIGFAFANLGYRNIQIQGIYALTAEPRLLKLPRQIYLWSSAYLQSCFYFSDLVLTPLKVPVLILKHIKERITGVRKKIHEKRKIKEAYRQGFGVEYTKKYGRPIGWFIFTSLLEKITFPIVIVVFILIKWWEPLIITMIAEVLIFSTIIAFMHKKNRIRNFFKSILIAPLRYTVLLYDLFVLSIFVKDLITRNRKWRK